MTFAWQAGTGDSHSRAFNARTLNDGTNNVGYAWYGFADKFDQTGGSHTDAVIDKMICNWAGPGGDHNVSNTNAQAQKITLNSSNVWAVSEDKITYAPVNSCTYDGTGTFAYGTTSSDTTDALISNLEDISALC